MLCGRSKKRFDEAGRLLEGIVALDEASPLRRMDIEERLVADYHGTGLTTGHHPMAYRREVLRARGVKSAIELRELAARQAGHDCRLRHHAAAPRNGEGTSSL